MATHTISAIKGSGRSWISYLSLHITYSVFVVKGIRLFIWRTKSLNIGGTNLTNVQYANIGNQIKFIDTIKYNQQSRSSLASSVDGKENRNIWKSKLDFLKVTSIFSRGLWLSSRWAEKLGVELPLWGQGSYIVPKDQVLPQPQSKAQAG